MMQSKINKNKEIRKLKLQLKLSKKRVEALICAIKIIAKLSK